MPLVQPVGQPRSASTYKSTYMYMYLIAAVRKERSNIEVHYYPNKHYASKEQLELVLQMADSSELHSPVIH